MVRQKNLGTEICPNCGDVGRKHEKNVRDRPTSRYIRRWYFLHNNRAIKECYIDSFVRNKTDYETHPIGEFLRNINMQCEHYEKTMHDLKEMERQIKELPLGEDERQRFYSAFNCQIKMLELLGVIIQCDKRMADMLRANKNLTKLVKKRRDLCGIPDRAIQKKRNEEMFSLPAGERLDRQIQSGRFDQFIQKALEFDKGGLLLAIGDIHKNHDVIKKRQMKRRETMRKSYNHPPRTLPSGRDLEIPNS